MKFIKLIWFDIKNGIIKSRFFIISVLLVSLLFCIDFSVNLYKVRDYNPECSFGDMLVYVYGGMKEYIPSRENRFFFPVIWSILIITQYFGTLSYPFENLNGYGKQILLRTEGRSLWWLSKCVWNIMYSLLYHSVIWIFLLIYSVIRGYNIGFEVNTELIVYLFDIFDTESSTLVSDNLHIPVISFFLPVVVSVSLNILEMTVSMFSKTIISFLAMSCLTISSAYFLNSFFLGNYEMIVRYNMVISNGINCSTGFILSLVVIIVSVIVGLLKFRRYDIINS